LVDAKRRIYLLYTEDLGTSDDTRNPRTTTAMFVMRRQRDE
jgi:hypothetical protein